MKRRVAFRKKKKQNKGGMLVVSVVVALLFTVMYKNCSSLAEKRDELKAREAVLQEQIDEQNEYAEELVQMKKLTKTKKYAEKNAKEKLGLVYSDEIIFKPEDE